MIYYLKDGNKIQKGLFGWISKIKDRMYRTITPRGYHIGQAAKEFIKGDTRDMSKFTPLENEVWAKYLGTKYKGSSNLEPAIYRPTKGGATYDDVVKLKDESLILSDDVLKLLLDNYKKTGKKSMLVKGNETGLGTYTISMGEDEKGKYISYYDDWDINPTRGISAKYNIPILNLIGDIVPGTHPFSVYGRRYYKNGGLIRKMQTASGGPIHYSRTMTSDNLSKAANYVGEYVLKGLGALGKIFTAPLTGGPLGPATVVLPKTKKLLDAERKLRETQELLIGKAMTWVSPLNYGAALMTGNGLNAGKGEEEVASWSPAWLAAARLGELYVGPKAVKGVKAAPRIVVNTAAKAGVKPAKAVVVAREIKLATKNKPNIEVPKAETRTRVGDVEINNPQLAYRLGDNLIKDLYNSGIVRTPEGNYALNIIDTGKFTIDAGRGFYNPMFALGELWYTPGVHSDLLVTAKPLSLANKGSAEVPSKINGTFDVRNYTYKPTRIGVRRVPSEEGEPLTISDVTSYKWIPGYGYKKVIQEPLTSLKFFERPTLSNIQELAGATKWERNFKPKWHIANYPGYLLKGLMKGSLLEKQLSKNGTININLLNAYFNKASQIEKDVVSKVLNEQFAGLKNIDYNLFKKAVLNELISYSRKPQTRYSVYGMDRLGFKVKRETDGAGGLVEYTPGIKTNTFSFESSNIPTGNARHYDSSTLGHSRTYTTPDEPNILHVIESLSDWGQSKFFESIPRYLTEELEYMHANNAFKRLQRRVPLQFKEEYNRLVLDFLTYGSEFPDNIRNSYSEEFKDFVEDLLNPYAPYPNRDAIQRWNRMYNYNSNPLYKYLHDNYLLRLLQENLKYAAENGLTKMRYPTSKTASKIEGYLKVALPRSTRAQEIELRDLLDKMWKEYYDANESQLSNASLLELKLIGRKNIPNYAKIMDELELLENIPDKYEYTPEHQTILKKYTDFPKLFLKLYKGLNVRTVTDAKGNTWYEVDVPKGYLSREWLFKQGGKMNAIELFKQGSKIHIKKKNRGKFTAYCGGNVTSACIAKAKASGNPTLVKRATFAANARKWKHQQGGQLNQLGQTPWIRHLTFEEFDSAGNKLYNRYDPQYIWDMKLSGATRNIPDGGASYINNLHLNNIEINKDGGEVKKYLNPSGKLTPNILKAETGLAIDPMIIDYIKAIENPDKIGWDGKVWRAPKLKGYDLNQRGYGIDVRTNNTAKNLTAGRNGQWLTNDEADTLMKNHILYINDAANKHINGFSNLSKLRQAALLGMLYRGDSVNKSNININEPDDNKFFDLVHSYYISKGLKERADNSMKFFKNNKPVNILFNFNNYKDLNYPFKFLKEGGKLCLIPRN